MKNSIVPLILLIGFVGCEPLVTKFPDVEEARYYESETKSSDVQERNPLTILTWNIRFGAGRIPWFGDSCGERVILTRDEVITNLKLIADKINELSPDVVLLQEVDIQSKRTDYVDQVQWLLDHTDLNYGTYASMWQAQYIPSDGLGRINSGQAILSRWKMDDHQRIPLALRSDQSGIVQYFYLRRSILKARIQLPNHNGFYVLNIHASAFSTDDTKQKHLNKLLSEMDAMPPNALFVAGGDLNSIPPGSDSTNYCDEDRCPDDPASSCRDGSDFTSEIMWLGPLYSNYTPVVPHDNYLNNNQKYFTHSTSGNWNRKLDYLFTNGTWITGSDSTFLDLTEHSDHAPVLGRLEVSP